ncbi:mismatch repair endonuclease PMS2 isoform X2 [Oratosquilla oratoria]|uniref:mismatch repair endonuclease PMS2 isoform X2 n=1 Tax=Oratosquilla oratoria TaxID=337810 RepID=UPI003F7594F3
MSDGSGGVETKSNKDGENIVAGTDEAAKSIKAIDRTTVHRICSGQVVLTLGTAVKELVENSVDAGATSVEVRLKDHGGTLIEVSDNGLGVEESDFEGLTLKHHTSKIRDFGDVVGVETYGFRGEALSSLCALGDLTITTRHASQEVGTKLVYDNNGRIKSKTPTPRQIGTTVTIQNLFYTLPVRHKEFQRNIKKEFHKMVHVLYSYCLISTGVRLSCTNQNEKGKKTTIVATSSHSVMRDNIISIFGAKQVENLLEFKQVTAGDEVLSEFGLEGASFTQDLFSLEGYVSTCAHGQGRTSTDRQFYFINSRPCDPAKIIKLVNEVYHQYNRYQYPCIVLNIKLLKEDVDINVTPDKRQILVNNEKLLLATIKASLHNLYEIVPSSFKLQNTTLTSLSFVKSSPSTPETPPSAGKRLSYLSQKFGRESPGNTSNTASSPLSGALKRSSSDADADSKNKQPRLDMKKSLSEGTPVSEKDTLELVESQKDTSLNESEALNGEICENAQSLKVEEVSSVSTDIIEEECNNTRSPLESEVSDRKDAHLVNGFKIENNVTENGHENETNLDVSVTDVENSDFVELSGVKEISKPVGMKSLESFAFSPASRVKTEKPTSSPSSIKCKKLHDATDNFLMALKAKQDSKPKTELKPIGHNNSLSEDYENGENEVVILNEEGSSVELNGETSLANKSRNYEEESPVSQPENVKPIVVICDGSEPIVDGAKKRKRITVRTDISKIREKCLSSISKDTKQEEITRKFRAKIAPNDNQSAEDELRKELDKASFSKMEILGQFNLGFIIGRLNQDLFIIDQHATDEKYNFETLQQTCTLQNQKLIIPQVLELTASNEAILMDNMHVFVKNGFEFSVNEEECAGRRVKLVSMPVSRGWEFGRGDIEELIFMLSDSPGVMCRPSRVRAMFASRACRKSIMIGTALSKAQMRRLVDHMGEMDQPWNCPHGRPTMRHLINLDLIQKAE